MCTRVHTARPAAPCGRCCCARASAAARAAATARGRGERDDTSASARRKTTTQAQAGASHKSINKSTPIASHAHDTSHIQPPARATLERHQHPTPTLHFTPAAAPHTHTNTPPPHTTTHTHRICTQSTERATATAGTTSRKLRRIKARRCGHPEEMYGHRYRSPEAPHAFTHRA